TQAKSDRARRGDAHSDHFKSDRVGRQTQAARALTPNELAEAEHNECEPKGRDRPYDRIATGKARRNDPSVEQGEHRRRDDTGNPTHPFGPAGIGDLPSQKSAKRTERALSEIKNT